MAVVFIRETRVEAVFARDGREDLVRRGSVGGTRNAFSCLCVSIAGHANPSSAFTLPASESYAGPTSSSVFPRLPFRVKHPQPIHAHRLPSMAPTITRTGMRYMLILFPLGCFLGYVTRLGRADCEEEGTEIVIMDTDDVGVVEVDEAELLLRVVLLVSSELTATEAMLLNSVGSGGIPPISTGIVGGMALGVVVVEATPPGGYGHQ